MFHFRPCCADCKYANWYPMPYMYPHYPPKCLKHKRDITPNDVCSDFELIGRRSR